jgi:hypothetical protein
MAPLVSLGVLAVLACGAFAASCLSAPPPAASTAAATASVASVSSPPREPSGAPSAAAPEAASVDAAPRGCPAFAPSLERGRAETRDGRYESALAALEAAIAARPFSAEAWAERGYAELRAGRDDAIESLAIARSLTARKELLAAIEHNQAEAYARAGKIDDARLFHAVAAADGNRVSAAKLGGRSRCTATWETTGIEALNFARSWREVLARMPPAVCAEERRAQASEAAARREACRGCESLLDPLGPSHGCGGAGPFVVPNGHMHCHNFSVTIQPVSRGRFRVDTTDAPTFEETPDGFRRTERTGGPHEARHTEVPASVMGGAPAANGCRGDVTAEVDLHVPEHCMAGEARVAMRGPLVTTYWDDGGQGVLAVSAWHDPVTVTFLTPRKVRIDGAGCAETVDLGP